MKLLSRTRRRATQFRRSRRGSVAIQIGIILPVLIGMCALGAEITFATYKHRQQQSAADTAALGGATAIGTGYPKVPSLEAFAIAASAGYVNGVSGTTVTVNNPPASGVNTGNKLAVEVIVSQPQSLAMTSLFKSGLFTIKARAVAVGSGYPYCALALDPSASGAISIGNNSIVSNPYCGVAANSVSTSALILHNNAQINGPVSVHGNWLIGNGALNGHPQINNGPIIADPYAGVNLQTIPGCTGQQTTGMNLTLTAGHFCNGWNFFNNVTVNLGAGTYYIDQQFFLGNKVTINGTGGTTLVINGNYAIAMGTNDVINITAPTTGNYAGLAFFGLRTATSTITQTFSNNVTMNIQGAVYFPNQIVEFDNNGTTGSGGCTQVIARIVNINNNVRLDNNCVGTGVASIGSGLGQLAE